MYNFARIILILFFSAMCCCSKVNTITYAQVLTLQTYLNGVPVPNESVPADYFTYATVVASIDSTVVDSTSIISFSTDNGIFSVGGSTMTAKVDIHGKGYAYIKSKYIGPAHIQATVGGNYTQNIQIQFTTSYPDKIFVNIADTASDLPGNRIPLTATLYKYYGICSPGLLVQFIAVDTLGNSIGVFTNSVPSDTSGTATAQFSLNDATYSGKVMISGSLAIPSAQTVTGTNTILFLKN